VFIRKTVRTYKDRAYTNYLLVESVSTPQGPRQRTICSLGDLSPGPRAKWRRLVGQVEAALWGQQSLVPPEARAVALAERVRQVAASAPPGEVVAVHVDQVTLENARQAGSVHVAHQMWRRLGLDAILRGVGLSRAAQWLTEVMVVNRLVAPASEHAMPEWVNRTALGEILGVDLGELSDEALYRNLDRLYPNRRRIETALAERERTLFNLDDSFYFYDLTSTYFEGECRRNPLAQRGYSRDQRPDRKQVLVGLVLDRDGFPKAHEVFAGNRQDRTLLEQMLGQLEQRTGRHGGGTVIVDRGMAFAENLQQIRAHGHHYVVSCRQSERLQWLEEFASDAGWQQVRRQPSPRNPAQRKSEVWVKCVARGEELYVLCRSDGRKAKDQAIRHKHEQRLLADLRRLQARIAAGRLRQTEKIHEALGRLKERYSRVARYYALTYEPQHGLRWHEDAALKDRAIRLDGAYLLRTDHTALSAEEAWRLYILLTRVEDAFRDLKSPLSERPIFHQLQHRVETHIFLCVLAYHLLITIEKTLLDRGVHTSWATLREQLATHQVVTAVLPTTAGQLLKIRKATTPEPTHRRIYDLLAIPHEVVPTRKTLLPAHDSDEKQE
jgi:transposase